MGLLTDDLRAKLPPLYSTEREPDPMVWMKFSIPAAGWIWYVVEFDGEDLFYGFVIGFEKELGYFRLSELEAVGVEVGIHVERDERFRPARLSQIVNRSKNEGKGCHERV